MKILVVSLLRIGDLLLAAPVIQGLKQKYPDSRIDVLGNRSCQSVAALIPGIDVFHGLNRDLLQAELADPDQPILKPFFRLEKLMSALKNERYDLVVNLTHNRLSGWLCGYVEGKETMGLRLDARGKPGFGSNWFQYLNDRADAKGKEIFHYTDIFWFGSGLQGNDRRWALTRTEAGGVEASRLTEGIADYILVQAFTSEAKKEWGADRWHHALELIQKHDPSAMFLILGAPGEAERVEEMVRSLEAAKVRARPAVCSFAAALSLLDSARLLITGDTSIKHLAAATKCPVIELSLGSSDWRRTGFYRAGGYILQPKVHCAPCAHSLPCGQASHLCAIQLAPDTVAAVATGVLDGDDSALHRHARSQSHRCDILRTHFTGGGYWQAVHLGRNLEPADLREWVDKLTTKLILQGAHFQALGPYGTEATRMGEWLRAEYPGLAPRTWAYLIQNVDQQTATDHSEALDAGVRLGALMRATRDAKMVELGEMRKLQVRIEDAERRLDVRRRLMRSLKDAVEAAI